MVEKLVPKMGSQEVKGESPILGPPGFYDGKLHKLFGTRVFGP